MFTGPACANQSIPHPEVVILEIRELILTSYANQDLRLWSAEARILHPSRLAKLKGALEATRSDSAPRAGGFLMGERGNGNAL